jgi:predicted dehydrogenase
MRSLSTATATDRRLDVHADPDFLDRIRNEPPGGVAIFFSGRSNRAKIERILAAPDAGLHVLADKPAIIEPADLPRLDAALVSAQERRLVLADMMTGRHNTILRLLQALRSDPNVFGDPVPGTRDEPGVLLSGVHGPARPQGHLDRAPGRARRSAGHGLLLTST